MGTAPPKSCTWCMTDSPTSRPARSTLLLILGCLSVTGALVSACGTEFSGDEAHRAETFQFEGPELRVNADYSKVEVREGGGGEVTVAEDRTVIGTGADSPQWTLTGNVLDLGKPCGGKSVTVGLCEITYTVIVPAGTHVDVQTLD